MENFYKNFPKEVAEKMKETEKDTVIFGLSNKGDLPLTQSKVGGVGYFPKNMEFPKGRSGEPLRLMAQINFSEMPELEGYPREGILAFYFDESDDLYGMGLDEFKNQDGYRIYYFEKLDEESLTRDFYKDHPEPEYPVIEGEYALSFEKKKLPILTDSYEFIKAYGADIYEFYENLFEGEKEDDMLDAALDAAHEISENESGAGQIGGYPYFTQEDPRIYEEALQTDQLLFLLDSAQAEDIEIMWGDVGIANFFINPEDLRKRDFHKAWFNWDCY